MFGAHDILDSRDDKAAEGHYQVIGSPSKSGGNAASPTDYVPKLHSDGCTILFADAIHRSNTAQQDAFLQHVESGLITLIGATTENPSFEVIPALLSRCRVIPLKSLAPDEIGTVLGRALGDRQRTGLFAHGHSLPAGEQRHGVDLVRIPMHVQRLALDDGIGGQVLLVE